MYSTKYYSLYEMSQLELFQNELKLNINKEKYMRIGVDFGTNNTDIIALDSKTSKAIYSARRRSLRGYKANLENLIDMINEVEKTVGKKGTVGVCIPALIDRKRGLINTDWMPWLTDMSFFQNLGEALSREIRIENVCKCLAVSESTDGAGAGYDIVFAVGLATGAGAGIVIKGELIHGANNLAGEWGQNSLPWPQEDEWMGFSRYGGKRDFLEDFISAPGLERTYKLITGKMLTPPEIMLEVRKGDIDSQIVFSKYIDRLARCFASIIHILDPDIIVVGGGMSNIKELYQEVPKVSAAHKKKTKARDPFSDPRTLELVNFFWRINDPIARDKLFEVVKVMSGTPK